MNEIILQSISKKFTVGREPQNTLSYILQKISGREPKKELWAITDITFSAKPGDIIGIIGKNRAGKSTLLNLIANIYIPTKGTITTYGNIVPIIGLVRGFRDRLTMHENIEICCSLLGLTSKEIKEKIDVIVGFTELHQYKNTKLYQFSDGMRARLAFSIAIHSNPEILLLDEATNASDKNFLQKIEKALRTLVSSGSIILIASHDMSIIRECNHVLWLSKGRMVENGKNTSQIIGDYLKED
tara:strand:- start:5688 stop:6413 length:726 start_codon:yes stop_codon:yes gene_type:complete